jgi:nitrogen fixation NifU-like protein
MTSELDGLEKLLLENMGDGYTETVINHALRPRNVGSIPDADGYASVTGPCGDTMQVWLTVKDNRIAQATFWTDGCGTTIAAGSMATELAIGKAVPEALRLRQEDILNALGGLPEESIHCALLAANTLREAIRDYLAVQREPWKKAYRKR